MISANTGLDDNMLSKGTKPLRDIMLTYYQLDCQKNKFEWDPHQKANIFWEESKSSWSVIMVTPISLTVQSRHRCSKGNLYHCAVHLRWTSRCLSFIALFNLIHRNWYLNHLTAWHRDIKLKGNNNRKSQDIYEIWQTIKHFIRGVKIRQMVIS